MFGTATRRGLEKSKKHILFNFRIDTFTCNFFKLDKSKAMCRLACLPARVFNCFLFLVYKHKLLRQFYQIPLHQMTFICFFWSSVNISNLFWDFQEFYFNRTLNKTLVETFFRFVLLSRLSVMLSRIKKNRWHWFFLLFFWRAKLFSNDFLTFHWKFTQTWDSDLVHVLWSNLFYRWHKSLETQIWLQWLHSLSPDHYQMLTRQLMTQTRLLITRLFRSLFSYSSFSNLLRSEVHSQFFIVVY